MQPLASGKAYPARTNPSCFTPPILSKWGRPGQLFLPRLGSPLAGKRKQLFSLLLALQPPLGSGQGHSQILAGGWGRDGEGETQLGTIAGSLGLVAGPSPRSSKDGVGGGGRTKEPQGAFPSPRQFPSPLAISSRLATYPPSLPAPNEENPGV